MYIQQTTSDYYATPMPMQVSLSPCGRKVTVRWGTSGEVHQSYSLDEAVRLRDGIDTALAAMRAGAVR